MPPQWQRSGWTTETACFSISSRKPNFVNRRSPAAMGIVVLRDTRTISSTFSGSTGSSTKSG